jgi:hypothetical protein|tara:strand:- start:897 stop:2144 length:1248 start_codon:yes stop_codon:yes gene_type:complete
MTEDQATIPPADTCFESETIRVVGFTRDTYARIIEQKCPGSKSVTSVAKAFGIHRKLAWQVIKVAYAEDPFVAAKHMPTPKSVKVWSDAVQEHGMASEHLESIHSSSEQFQSLIKSHASNRSEFEMLIESCNKNGDHSAEERWRQQAFEGNCFTWGAHCNTLLALCILMPSEDRENYFHAAQIKGMMGFRQTRPDMRWVVNQSVAVDDDIQHEQAMERQAIDPAAALEYNGVPVLPEYCSNPMPKLERSRTHDGMMQDEFLSSEVGLQGQRTLVTGELLRNIAPTHAMPNDKIAHFGSSVRTPTEMFHFDLFVKAGLFGDVERELKVFSDIVASITFSPSDELILSDKISKMGRGISLAHAPDLPGYHDLAASIFSRLSLNPDEYELYRIRIAYPPFPCTIMVKHELLPKESFES